MVARTRLIVTLYVNCLSFLNLKWLVHFVCIPTLSRYENAINKRYTPKNQSVPRREHSLPPLQAPSAVQFTEKMAVYFENNLRHKNTHIFNAKRKW
jgi:hypothetical protein